MLLLSLSTNRVSRIKDRIMKNSEQYISQAGGVGTGKQTEDRENSEH
jgi:hypothetical protein